jgi:hypothetical protein
MPAANKATAPVTEYVPHPRYGSAPRFTSRKVVDCHSEWAEAKRVPFIPGTAVKATPSRQRSMSWNGHHEVHFYVDEVRKCRTCRREYLFFADEQRFWYDILSIPMEVHPVRCARCRKADRQAKRMPREYRELLAMPETSRTAKQHLRLAALGIALRDAGVFTAKLLPKIRSVLKLIPEPSRDREWKTLDAASKP